MSVSYPETECMYCDETYREGYDESYCSSKCKYRKLGERALENIKTDHRVCATCASVLKETSHPGEEWTHLKQQKHELALDNGAKIVQQDGGFVIDATDCKQEHFTDVNQIIGFQYTTDRATNAVDETDDVYPISFTRIGCECGAVDPSDTIEEIQSVELKGILERVVDRLQEKEREGRLSKRIDRRNFYELVSEYGDIEYAVGRALYSGSAD